LNKTVVTKGEYARLKGRSPAAVSNWIKEGKITPSALEGKGNRARVWVEQADADLARGLDPAQQAAQPAPAVAPIGVPGEQPAEPYLVRASKRAAEVAAADEDLSRRRKADADKAEYAAEKARRELAVAEGRWIDAAAAQQEWGRELAKLVGDVETFIAGPLARELANKYGLDWKALSVEARGLFRLHRGEKADAAAAELATLEQDANAAE
jgi:hypothetical protein